MDPIILVHGGAWGVPDYWVEKTVSGVKMAASIGHQVLKRGGSSLDAVEAAVKYLEDNEVFNAGHGSSLNMAGQAVMESSIQRGSDLRAGCVTLLRDIPNPISLARKVLEETPHAFLAGEGARDFATKQGFPSHPPESFVTKEAKEELQEFLSTNGLKSNRQDTVGAVAVDQYGNVAAGTSTGGTAGKYVGRIGDAPLIGSGTYADDLVGAVSCTGHGESILKYCLSHTIIKLMEGGLSCAEASKKAVEGMTARVCNTGGAICVSNKGDIGFHFTTKRMSWCYIKNDETHFGIEPDEHKIEKFISATNGST